MLDVVIPYHGRLDWLRLCLEALATMTANPLTVILVDSGNTAEDRAAAQILLHRASERHEAMATRHVHLAQNQSFSHAINAGVKAGYSPYVVILNSDVVVTPRWDAHLIGDLQDPAVGLVGARSNYSSGVQGTDLKLNPTFLVFYCVALRRTTWEAVGELDATTFHDWCGGEDIDYSWRVSQTPGLALKVSDLKVYHAGSQTYRKDHTPAEQNKLHDKAEERLRLKWGPETYRQLRANHQKRVCIGILSVDERVSLSYMRSMLHMKFMGGPCAEVGFSDVTRTSPGWARQWLAEDALKSGYDYLLMIDDDMRFEPYLLHNLLYHQVEVVAPLAYGRKPPHKTVAYQWQGDGFANLEAIEHRGLMKVDAIGMGAVLIHTDVFRRVPGPWFKHDLRFGEDLGFCKHVGEHGVQIYCDTNMILGHMGDQIEVNEGYVKAWRQANAMQQATHAAVKVDA